MKIMRRNATGIARNLAMVSIGLMGLAGCEDMNGFQLFQPKSEDAAQSGGGPSATRLVERDVEAPDVFEMTDQGLWDGRPSLGGVWVAHPDVKTPERVIVRNTANNTFVIGALFRRERENPGPVFQVSSDAASALGMLAGAPSQLNVTALRRETAPEEVAPEEVTTEDAPAADLSAPESVKTSALDSVAGAAAAIDAAEASATATPAPSPAAAPAPRPQASTLEKPFIQIGIFSVEQNANNTATAMRQAGMIPTVKKQSASGKPFWRVIVGPAANSGERAALLKKVKEIGFVDAYSVTN